MSDLSEAFLSKARESLDGAASELANGRYNNCANRCYYACFQAAVAALDLAGIRPTEGRVEWSHSFVKSQFPGQLVYRRKLYSSELRKVLAETSVIREQADYKPAGVSRREATRAFNQARALVDAVVAKGTTT